MKGRSAIRIVLGAIGLFAIVGAGWILSLPPKQAASGAPAISKEETDATLGALRPPKRQRPLIAIVGVNDGTEVTDYVMPYGILRRADIADVVALGTEPGPMRLYPALRVQPEATLKQFDEQHPGGADYVIVPAMERDDDATVLEWLQSQAAKGAMIVGVCAGAPVVANAGLLDGKRATTHWYFVDGMLEAHPTIQYVPDRRMVVDRGVATTTGISASMPASLTLIEAIAGRAKAEAVARDLGLPEWDVQHESDAFRLTRSFALTAMKNRLAFWKHEKLGLEVTPGIDEVSLVLVADAWSRTYRSRAVTLADTLEAQRTRSGLLILPDQLASAWPQAKTLPALVSRKPADALDEALQGISERYGPETAAMVTIQLEYPGRASAAQVFLGAANTHWLEPWSLRRDAQLVQE